VNVFVQNKWPILVAFMALIFFSVACVQVPFLTAPLQSADTTLTAPTTVVQKTAGDGERTLIDLYQQLIPGVVNVQVLQRNAENQVTGGAGSGFVFDRQGHIVTNAHVVRDAQLVDVVLYDDTTIPAEIVGLDDDSDLAVLKIDLPSDQLVPLSLADSDLVVPGQQVVAIGNPFGQQGSMTSGIVSAVGRTIPSLTPFSIPQAIQTDAAINPGNSGGPLLNLRGEVIGVNAQIESAVRANAGVGFAIPANIVARVVPVLIQEGKFTWPWLGVQGTNLTLRMATANELTVARGAYIADIVPGSPAADAGLRGTSGEAQVDGLPVPIGGDVVLAVDGREVRSMDDLILLVSQQDVGGQVALTVLRAGEEIQLALKLAARPDGRVE
jgi:S1-C subfamily serine protease